MDEAGATHLFSALDGRTMRLTGIAGPPAAALWDEDDCNCAVLVCGGSSSTPAAMGSAASPAAGAGCSVHTVVYTPRSLDGPSELPCGTFALHGCVMHLCDGVPRPFLHAGVPKPKLGHYLYCPATRQLLKVVEGASTE